MLDKYVQVCDAECNKEANPFLVTANIEQK